VSYAHSDLARNDVEALCKVLFEGLQDRTSGEWQIDFNLGPAWEHTPFERREMVQEAVRRATVFMPLLTPGYFWNPYCQFEIERYLDLNQTIPPAHILPIQFGEVAESDWQVPTFEYLQLVQKFQLPPWATLHELDRGRLAQLLQPLVDAIARIGARSVAEKLLDSTVPSTGNRRGFDFYRTGRTPDREFPRPESSDSDTRSATRGGPRTGSYGIPERSPEDPPEFLGIPAPELFEPDPFEPLVAALPPEETSAPTPAVPLPATLQGNSTVVGCGGADAVDCSLFCPPTPRRGDRFLVQVFAHRPEQQAEVRAEAEEVDSAAVRRGHKRLRLPVAIGTVLQIEVRAPSLELERATEELVWTGQPEAVQFVVTVPAHHPPGSAILTLTIGVDGIPLGRISGTINVVAEASEASKASESSSKLEPSPLGEEAVRYEKAFTSYASADRAEVLRRVQAVRAVGLKCFQDVIDLEPGQRWEQSLYKHIDECDLFLLFWSTHAKNSEWVMKEARYALARQAGKPSAPPAIRPIVLENPPALPPSDLAHLHFNDLFAQLIHAKPGA